MKKLEITLKPILKKIRAIIHDLKTKVPKGKKVAANKLALFFEKFIGSDASFTLNGITSSLGQGVDFIKVSGEATILSQDAKAAANTINEFIDSLNVYKEAFQLSIKNSEQEIALLNNEKNLNFSQEEMRVETENYKKALAKEVETINNSIAHLQQLSEALQQSEESTLSTLTKQNTLVLEGQNFRFIFDPIKGAVLVPKHYTDLLQRSEAGVNVSLDNAKNPVLAFWNFTLSMSPIVNALNITGISGVEEFFQDPVIVELVEEFKRSKELIKGKNMFRFW